MGGRDMYGDPPVEGLRLVRGDAALHKKAVKVVVSEGSLFRQRQCACPLLPVVPSALFQASCEGRAFTTPDCDSPSQYQQDLHSKDAPDEGTRS